LLELNSAKKSSFP